MLILESPWTRQPQAVTGIDWSNPLTRGLVFLGVPGGNGSVRDLLTLGQSSTGSGASSGVSAAGLVTSFSGSQASGAVSYGDITTFDGATSITIGSVAVRSSTASGNLVAKWGIISEHGFLLNCASGSSNILLAVYTSATTFGIWTSTHSTPVNTQLSIAAAWKGGTSAAIACNGVIQTPTNTGGAVSGGIYTGTAPFQFGVASDGTPFAGGIALSPIWLRALSDAELLSFTKNPWQLFAPQRIPIPTPAAATVPTLSASTYVPGSMTSTGWRPQITAS